jgi:hypothetical protein
MGKAAVHALIFRSTTATSAREELQSAVSPQFSLKRLQDSYIRWLNAPDDDAAGLAPGAPLAPGDMGWHKTALFAKAAYLNSCAARATAKIGRFLEASAVAYTVACRRDLPRQKAWRGRLRR